MDISGISSAQQGMQQGFDNLKERSERLASPNNPDATGDLVSLSQDEKLVQSSAKALKAADDNLGTLLDIIA